MTSRIDIVGQNGNTGEHYVQETKLQSSEEMSSVQPEGNGPPLPTGESVQKMQDTSDETKVTWSIILTPTRGKDETYEQYRQRRKVGNLLLKIRKYGSLFWDSTNKGKYVKRKQNEGK